MSKRIAYHVAALEALLLTVHEISGRAFTSTRGQRDILRQALESEVDASFDTLAAELRQLTAQRPQTPAEDLQREGRNER